MQGEAEPRRGTLCPHLREGERRAVDPVEKKPLFHFLPGTLSYSLGGVGCNFHCAHCQNWHISMADADMPGSTTFRPKRVRRAQQAGCASISWTYNEPTIWHGNCTLDMGDLARKVGLSTVYVTNG